MRLDGYEILHCDAGWRKFSFLRLHADDGTSGLSEFNESYGSPALSSIIAAHLGWVMGADPMAHERISNELYARSPDDHDLLYSLGLLAIESQRYEDATRYLERLLELGARTR